MISISGGAVTATGGEYGAGIGGGEEGAGGEISISGGAVTAISDSGGAGIGAGYNGEAGTISLSWTDNSNDSITATSYGGTVTFVKDFAIEGESAALTPETISNANEKKIVPFGATPTPTDMGAPTDTSAQIDIVANVSYLDADGATQTAASATEVTSGSTAWSDGWYIASGAVTIGSRVSVTGDVHLILADGANLTVSGSTYNEDFGEWLTVGGINVSGGASLTIYAQSTGDNMGKLSATSGDGDGAAGIGGGGVITINGGAVTATGNRFSAGIGGGDGGAGGTIAINGGAVTAQGGDEGAGIGGGYSGAGGVITINGGAVTAQGGDNGAGIGGGRNGAGGTITINGGAVTAQGGNNGAGIGGGRNGAGGTIALKWTDKDNDRITASSYSGTVTFVKDFVIEGETTALTPETISNAHEKQIVPWALELEYLDADGGTQHASATEITSDSAAWSDGWYGVSGEVTIGNRVGVSGDVHLILADGANLTINGGINVGNGASLTIYAQSTGDDMGKLSATGGEDEAGIGGGKYGAGGAITINGGVINANSSSFGAGIGGGWKGNGGAITINGGVINAYGNNGAAIGSGDSGATGGVITINGGTITASGGIYGAGIGGGDDSAGGVITINGGTITASARHGGGAGIGGGDDGAGGEITINGGVIRASAEAGPGIGNGKDGGGGTITLGWTPESKDAISVTASSYSGTVTFEKGFAVDGESVALTQQTISSANGKKIVPCHTHHWVSVTAVSDDTFTATCGNDDGIYNDDTEHGALSYNLTIVPPDASLTYDGTTQFPATVQDSQGVTQTQFTISYEKRNAEGGWDAVESVPVEAGTYRASVTAGEGDSSVTAFVEYAVATAVVDSVTVTDITEPVAGEAFDTSAQTSVGVTPGAVTWEPSADAADYGTVYTASVTVTAANENYVFSSDTITATINGEEASVVKNADGTLTISRAFPMTARALDVEYLDADGKTQTAENALEIKSGSTAWNTGWYVVNGEVTIEERVSVTGDVRLILADGANLTASGGINVSASNSLTIYAQSTGDDMGKLSATGGEYQAGIGGNYDQSAGTITINGGAGIGGSLYGDVGTIIINGGAVTATSGEFGAAIGGGEMGAGGAITINGGAVTATGASGGAAIGGGASGAGGAITINGGVVTATQMGNGAGIGSGKSGAGGAITINGGAVTASSNYGGAGIGGGLFGAGGAITVNGGTVTANGSGYGAAIGGGEGGEDGTVIINGGAIIANGSGYGGAGIGGVEITLNWTEKTKATISITASSYNGTVTFVKDFAIEGESAALTPETISNANEKKIVPFGDAPTPSDTPTPTDTPQTADNVPYLDADGVEQTAASATEITSGSTAWSDGWYVASDEVTIGSRVSVTGDVHLILADGANLTASGGINVGEGNSLTIYAQSAGDNMGGLSAAGGECQSGIGGGEEQSAGTITVNGGTVTANGGDAGAGIGGGKEGAGGAITVNGGAVTANGGNGGAATGGGKEGAGGIDATPRMGGGAGIGGGWHGAGGAITVNGGTVTATGAESDAGIGGAGIGGGYSGAGGEITVNGGTVTAIGNGGGAGIGGGYSGAGGEIAINGGTVTATGSEGGAVMAIGDNGGAGIGGGMQGADGEITLNWTDKDNDSITASSYGGTVTFVKAFAIEGESAALTPETISNANEKKIVPFGDAPTPSDTPTQTDTPQTADNVPYLDADGVTRTAESATEITSGSTAWSDGWYVASDEVTIGSRVSVTGDVHLILADGANLTASGGINVGDGASLTIYAQSAGDNMGGLSAAGGEYQSGIGGDEEQSAGTITINGGTVTANGGDAGAGIGGGKEGAGGAITVNGGAVTANGGNGGAATGGGKEGAGGIDAALEIDATPRMGGGAGIGGGWHGAGGEITVNGGTVTATGAKSDAEIGGAGIGGGYSGAGGEIAINGGTVTATGSEGGAVMAIGGNGGAGIGGGMQGADGEITLNWTDKDNDSITASSYGGTVTFAKAFAIEGETAALTPETISNANEKKIVPWHVHVHDWAYTLSEDNASITAVCNADGCGVTNGLTLTVSAPATETLTYDGTAKAAALNGDYNTEAFPGECAIAYSKDGVTLDEAPIAAGTYRASVTAGGQTAYVEYAIRKAEIRPVVTLDGWAYGETANSPSVTGNDGNGAVTYAYAVKGGAEFSGTVPTAVGEYTVKATIAATDNYNGGEATADFAISKASLTPTVSIEGWTYGEAANSPNVTGNTDNGAVTYAYAVKGGAEFSGTVPTNVGEYTVKATIAATDNYNGGEATADFAISKANLAPTVSIEGWTYGETANTPSVTGNDGNGAVTYAYAVKGSEDFSADVPTDAGEYTVKATIAATDNYNSGEATADFTIMPTDDTGDTGDTSTPDEPANPDEPVIYTVSFNLNGHGSNAPANQQVEEGQYASIPSAPANEGDFIFGGWTNAPENGDIFQFNATPITSNLTLYAFWIENVPEVTDEDVTEAAPTVGETEVDMSGVSADTKPEDMEALQEAAQSVQMSEPESAEEQAVQNAAMQSAVDGIDEATKQQENQSAIAALIAAGLVQQNEDGSLPEDIDIEITREVYMEVEAKGLIEEIVDGIVRKALSMDISVCYNLSAGVGGESIAVSGGNPTTIDNPIDLSVNLPDNFVDDNQEFIYINHTHNGKDYVYRGSVALRDGKPTLNFRAVGLSPFEITTDTMDATITQNVGGVSMELSYATLLEAVDAVENNGTITIVEPVTADIASSSKTYTLALGKDVTGADVSADDVTLTVDGKAVTFKDGKAVILAADASDNNPSEDTPGDNNPSDNTASGGCYVATSVYGSYDCPQVWTLRRFRDEVLAETWYGRLFIRLYYAVSPTAVKLFGDCEWFQNFFRDRLDKMVSGLQADGFESTPYQDLEW